MESTQSRNLVQQPPSSAQRKLIIDAWESLGRAAIGEAELREVQGSLANQFGQESEASPAAIARVLADEGAELRHPEVIEFDVRWRAAKLAQDGRAFKGFEDLMTGRPLRLKKAAALIAKLEKRRRSSEAAGDRTRAKKLRDLAVNGRQIAELLAKDRKLGQSERAEQAEIAEWLKVWIQTPSLFSDWLDLRRRSAEFQEKFSG